jgi:LuxR family maltose regulon positive regulatory protein
MLERILRSAEVGGRAGRVIEVLALQALTLAALQRLPEAVARLATALRLAEPEGYLRTFLDEGEAMAALLREAHSRGVSSRYVSRLLGAFGAGGQAGGATAPGGPVTPTEPLSAREFEVLRLVAVSRSNQEIADALYVSANTVKTHLKRLYAKLGVTSRLEAVERARKLDLL